MTTQQNHEYRIARQICSILDESADQIPASIGERLAAARRMALANKKAENAQSVPRLAPAGADQDTSFGLDGHTGRDLFAPLRKLGLLWTMLALITGLLGIGYWQYEEHIADLADIDAAMLTDELPPEAYADHGFHAFLRANVH